jgi:hypothetical protein
MKYPLLRRIPRSRTLAGGRRAAGQVDARADRRHLAIRHRRITTADGKKTLPFGDHPKGMLIFTADGHFSQVHVAGGLPRIASNNRLAGTDADNKAIVQGTLALFGTYSVDEQKKTLTFNIQASTYPNAEGTSQTRTIDRLTADEFRNTNPGAARDGPALASNLYTRAK